MRNNHAYLACCAVLFSAGPIALTHCSGSSSSSPSHGDASASGSSSGNNSSNGGGSSSGSQSDDGGGSGGGSSGTGSSGASSGSGSGAGGDGGTSSGGDGGASSSGGQTVPVPEGGVPSDPGVVPCGSATCTTSTDFCCTTTGGGDGGSQTCVAYNGGSCGTNAVKIGCNEAADCTSGVCCQQILGIANVGSTSCMPSCTYSPTMTGYYQTCRTDSECGTNSDGGAAAAKCIAQTCTAPGGPGGGGNSIDIEACAYYARAGGVGGGTGTWGPLPYCVAK